MQRNATPRDRRRWHGRTIEGPMAAAPQSSVAKKRVSHGAAGKVTGGGRSGARIVGRQAGRKAGSALGQLGPHIKRSAEGLKAEEHCATVSTNAQISQAND